VILWLLVAGLVIFMLLQRGGGGPPIGAPPPSISTPTLKGELFQLEEAAGKVVVLDFWATWCPPCQRALPALQLLHKRYKESDEVLILSVNTEGGSPEALRSFLGVFMKERRFDFPVLLDPQGQISDEYRIKSIPTLVVLSPKGLVHAVHNGLSSNHPRGIAEGIEQMIKAAKGI